MKRNESKIFLSFLFFSYITCACARVTIIIIIPCEGKNERVKIHHNLFSPSIFDSRKLGAEKFFIFFQKRKFHDGCRKKQKNQKGQTHGVRTNTHTHTHIPQYKTILWPCFSLTCKKFIQLLQSDVVLNCILLLSTRRSSIPHISINYNFFQLYLFPGCFFFSIIIINKNLILLSSIYGKKSFL